ncbi:hypothetical protein [Candidatus Tokpelaia sp.]|uniref:hypothetical protein n=1 Tax=Candidatus Tokpelaia sp. TaxID=2233777 RepID=UPI001AED6A4E|nr:hypothetical protein [Candidatus Tokpelaia sp.]
MRFFFASIALLSAFFAISSAQAEVVITCDIGTFRISADNLTLEDGHLSAKGRLYLNLRGNNNSQILIGNKNDSSNALDIVWEGNGNILKTKFGNIILSPAKDSPRVDIQFPDINFTDFYNGNKLLNPDGPLKQQGCIRQ